MSIEKLNNTDSQILKEEFLKCCGSNSWAEKLVNLRPFYDQKDLFDKSDNIWEKLEKADFLQAFTQHPKIGDINSLAKKFAHTKQWAENEQSGVDSAPDKTIEELAEYNKKYEDKYSYIFIVCATGKSAQEMLDILKSRIDNDPQLELKTAANEQNKITKIRLEKLLMSL